MARIGYARVSTREQNLDMQLAELKRAGCEKIFSEHRSGVKQRLELAEALKDLLDIISTLHDMDVAIYSIKDNIDTSSTSGKLMMHIFASLAEFERDLIIERTQAERKAAMKRGKKMGKPKLKHNNRAKATAMLYENGMGIEDEPRNNRCASA
nr:recombinase family protein [uncultured Prevotella sp.]